MMLKENNVEHTEHRDNYIPHPLAYFRILGRMVVTRTVVATGNDAHSCLVKPQ